MLTVQILLSTGQVFEQPVPEGQEHLAHQLLERFQGSGGKGTISFGPDEMNDAIYFAVRHIVSIKVGPPAEDEDDDEAQWSPFTKEE
jgi:hypothetical protein